MSTFSSLFPVTSLASLIFKEIDAGNFSLLNFWERRIRRIFPALAVVVFRKRRQVFAFAGASLAMLVVLGLLTCYNKGFQSRFPAKSLVYAESRNSQTFRYEVSLESAQQGYFIPLGENKRGVPADVLVWGDSHAMAVVPVVDQLCRQYGRRGFQATHSATPPVVGYAGRGIHSLREQSDAFNEAVLAFISSKSVKHVIIVADCADYPFRDLLKIRLPETVGKVLQTGAKVYILKPVPQPDFNVPRFAALGVKSNADLTLLGVSRKSYNARHASFAETYEQLKNLGAIIIDPSDLFLNDRGIYGVLQNDQLLFWDEQHLTVYGSTILAPLFEPLFQTN